ncbi:MAG: TAT-variant-translocated molybdopterin oxidoreductase [Elusimicrobia bacterium]|nr:TAT-variant-translocated molybdopterin oxidoreductase [Elusimicrobiota bacterium]
MADKRYWRSLEERDAKNSPPPGPEFPEVSGEASTSTVNIDRRTFLKAAGFSIGGVLLSACGRGPMNKVISYLSQPEEIVPGRAYWYASSCLGCSVGCATLVKTRDARPLKLEGNPEHPLSLGGLCAVGQASVLELYDDRRLRGPLIAGRTASWETVDRRIGQELDEIRRKGGRVRILSRTILSPTKKAVIGRFLDRFDGGRLVVYDPLSCSAMLDAHESAFGVRVLPRPRFDRAGVIASFDADFLGTWISPVEYSAGYRSGRAIDGNQAKVARHIQFESRLSLTGANADARVVLGPREITAALARMALMLAGRAGISVPNINLPPISLDAGALRGFADELWTARGRSLVVCGQNSVSAQLFAALANQALGNYGKTLDLEHPSYQKQGDDKAVKALLDELAQGRVDALFVLDGNPLAELPAPEAWEMALGKTPLVVSFTDHLDETAAMARFVCPEHNQFEAWGDLEPVSGLVAVAQPSIAPMGLTRPALESLSAWMGERKESLELIKEHWRLGIFPRRRGFASFEEFWNKTVHDGFAEIEPAKQNAGVFRPEALSAASSARSSEKMSLVVYAKVGMMDGRHAQNPWLQELPDPITKIVWDNYASISPAGAKNLGVTEGDVVKIVGAGGRSIQLPAHVQPGQHDGTVAVALGYGRKGTERFTDIGPNWLEGKPTVAVGERVGMNASLLLDWDDGAISEVAGDVSVVKTGASRALACTQAYHSLQMPARLAAFPGETRPIVRETTLEDYRKHPASGNEPERKEESLWPEHAYEGHRWGMAIDLGSCTGCSACVIACQAENNVPVVGKDEVGRRRDMAWLRIDRYYADRGHDTDVVFQPMMCQHCGNAPCETVCPVLATMHSSEGLNQQVYNRCVGTRYCENNCPYKVRRFNWFQYQKEGRLSNLALNPDVTVRMRGVMEKCSFCVQRIQEGKFEAKRQGRPLQDGDIRPACAQSCPAQAIVFGDLNDPKSQISRFRKDPRHYRVLADLNVQPSIGYLVKVRNRAADGGRPEDG